MATLPDLAWGVGGKVAAVHYPPGWTAAAAVINADPRPVAVLPVDSMRHFTWAGPAPVLDPLPRWVRADVLTTGDLTISGQTVPGEGGRARAVQQLLVAGADREALARAGVGWVVVESGGETAPLALPVAYRDDDLTVYRVGGDYPAASHRPVMIAAHLVWLAMLASAPPAWRFPPPGDFESGAAIRVQHRAQRDEGVAAGPVIDVHAAPLGLHESGPPQLAEVVADGGLAQVDRRREITAAFLAGTGTEQQRHQLDSNRIG